MFLAKISDMRYIMYGAIVHSWRTMNDYWKIRLRALAMIRMLASGGSAIDITWCIYTLQ